MSLSVNNSYQQNVDYVFYGLSGNFFMYTQSALLDYVDKHVSNPTLKLIMTGHGRLVDCKTLTADCLHLFEKELNEFKANIKDPLSQNDNELRVMAVSNYIDFVYQNFTPFQFFESIVICMVRNCKILPRMGSFQSKINLESFHQHKHLIDENPERYRSNYVVS
jgi:hypothetical protein